MSKKEPTLVLLTPAFHLSEQENWLPWQAVMVRKINELFPALKIVIITFHFPIGAEKKTDWHGNDVYLLNGALKKKIHTARRWIKAWRLLQRIRKERDVVGILSFFCSESALIGHYFAKRYGLNHKIWILGQDAKKKNKEVARIRPEPDELVCLSDFLRKEFYANHGIMPAHVVPCGVETKPSSGHNVYRDIDLLGAGSLIPLKQYDHFIDVVAIVSRQLPGVQAVVCGDGVERERLNEKLQALNLTEQVDFAGFYPHAETLRFMRRSKILLHPSAYEGLGMVMLEALYEGAHVISFVKPLDAEIDHWHQVQTKEEMAEKALELLLDTRTAFTPVLAWSAEDTARAIISLFGICG
jgi:glycosyltransferase involved in cell wall biosynthesis